MKIKQLYKKIKSKIKAADTDAASKTKKAIIWIDREKQGSAEYIVKTGEWVKEKAAPLEEQYIHLHGKKVIGIAISEDNTLAVKTRAKDAFLEQCLQSGDYTEDSFLVVKNPYLLSPLTALVLFCSKKAYRIKAEVLEQEDQEKEATSTTSVTTELTTRHRIPIIGLYPGKTNKVLLQFVDENNTSCKRILFTIKMKELPTFLENMVVVKQKQKPSAFPFTFVYGGDTRYPYAFNKEGIIRFYIARQPKPYGLHFLSNGHFLFAEKSILMPSFSNPHSSQILEMDLLGRVHKIYNVENGLHHDAAEMTPGGNIIAAGSSLENSNEDMVMELDRNTGKVVKQIKLGDVFDKTYQDSIDWVHLNTVSYDAKTNSVLICCRNLHTVASLDWETGEIRWILCHPKFWRETSMEEKVLKPVKKTLKKEGWSYQPHAAYFLEQDLDGNQDTRHMIIYDNHWHKRRSVPFFDHNPNSFVRIYTINEKEHTVALWKSFPCAKSKIRSNGILCYEQNRLFAMSGYLEPMMDGCSGMINEYDFQTGELYNQYLTKASYYRAYELPLYYADLSKPVSLEEDYMLGTIRQPQQVKRPELSGCMPLPERDIVFSAENLYYKGTKNERKKKYEEALENGDTPFDIEQDIANTELALYENILYLTAVDHLIKRIYFVGEKFCYMQDYTDTKQMNPALFARLYYSVMIPLGEMQKDTYQIYLECEGRIYNTEKRFIIE